MLQRQKLAIGLVLLLLMTSFSPLPSLEYDCYPDECSTPAPQLSYLESIKKHFKSFDYGEKPIGRIGVGGILTHVDFYDLGRIIKKVNLKGFRADGIYMLWGGVCIKPSLMMAWGEGRLLNGGISIGHFLPLTKKLLLLPNIGYMYSNHTTTVGFLNLMNFDVKIKMHSPYIGLDAIFFASKCWRIMGCVQYSWCKMHMDFIKLHKVQRNSRGPNWGILIERSITKNWTVNCGGGVNISLSREKNGFKSRAITIGAAYTFF